jgi:signal transduction histidine kinase/DNA-binding response OmpR family regulator
MSTVEKLIDIYHNSHDVQSLCLTIAHDWNTKFILISWYITENTWYIPMIFDKNIRGLETNKSLGWYINEEPTADNIPILHSDLINPVVYKYDNRIIIIDSSKTIDSIYLFVVESFINSLAHANCKERNKYQREILLNNICHSIRTPLNGILHMTNMLLSTDKLTRRSTSKQTKKMSSSNIPPLTSTDKLNIEHLQYLNQSVVSLANNIFDIVDMSQLSLGKLKINKDIFNVRELVNQVIAISTTMSKNKSINVDYYVEHIVPEYAYCDAKRIKQILINLMENAFRNTTSGEVTLYVTASLIYLDYEDCNYNHERCSKKMTNQYNITFKVADTGSGIDDKTVAMLFKPTKVLLHQKHHGIGLRVSYLLADKLGGDLRLKSTSPNGSTFELSIIVYEEEPPKFDSATLKTLSNKRVLLIDDSNDKINVCKVMDACCIIYNIASSYEEVLILHMHKTYDLIICQTQLKDEDSINIAERLSDNWGNALFLAISSNSKILPKGIFHDSISLPIEEYTIKNKLITMFNTNYDTNTNTISILAVEDEQINRIIIEKLLRAKGYTDIEMVSNGKEALKILDSNKYNIVLVDIRMPIMSGFEFAQHVHTIFGKNRPRLIGITAQMIMEDDPKELFDDFVYKPVNIDELDKKIKKMKEC